LDILRRAPSRLHFRRSLVERQALSAGISIKARRLFPR
jgi:hypothetical protein